MVKYGKKKIDPWKSGKFKKHPNDEFVEYKIIK